MKHEEVTSTNDYVFLVEEYIIENVLKKANHHINYKCKITDAKAIGESCALPIRCFVLRKQALDSAHPKAISFVRKSHDPNTLSSSFLKVLWGV